MHAWILLAIPSQGATTRELLWRAAAINNTEPTELEIEESVGWLRDAGLIEVESDRFIPTASGKRLLEEEWDSTSMMDTWSRVARRLG